MFLGYQVTQIFNNPSYISTKAPGLMGCSTRKNENCNITIDIMKIEVDRYSSFIEIWSLGQQ